MPGNGNTEEDEIESEQMLDQRKTDSGQPAQQTAKQTIKYVPGRGSSRYNNALQNLIPLRPKVKEKEKPPEENVGLFSFLYLSWFTKYLWKAYRKGIDKSDLPSTSIYNSCAYNCQRLEILWKEELGRRGSDGASFTLVAWRFARTRILLSCFLYGCSVIFGFLSPAILMRKVLEYLQETEESSYVNGIKWAFLLILCEVCRLTFINWSWNMNVTTARRLKSACLALLYKKIIGLNSLGNKSTGELINVFSSDGQKAFDLMLFGPQIVGGPVATICGIIYILFALSPMALLGMIVFSLFYIFQYLLTRITKYYKSRCLKITDIRIKTISEILECIKLIKLYAWEKFITRDVLRIRQEEKKWLTKLAFYDSTTISLTPTVSIIAAIVTFLAHLSTGNNLTVAQAFPILSIIIIVLTQASFVIKDGAKDYKPARIAFSNFKVFPLLSFLNVQTRSALTIVYIALLNILEGNLTFNRIKSVLLLEETNCHISKPIVRSQALSILNGKFVYDNFETRPASSNSVDKGKKSRKKKTKRLMLEKRRVEILSDITFEAGKGHLIGICGHVGSGKSSLLLASLGQLRMISGQAMRNGSCAYVGQQAWIINATFKENVIFGGAFDPKRYYRALSICSLKEDIIMLPSGDETEIGERGVNLSGGQKQRLALARAFYANRDIYFLDDPLSAVDTNVGLYIFENLILGALREKTVLFVTHQVQYLNRCDDIYMMYNGRIIEHGKHEELMHADKEYAVMVKNSVIESQDSSPEEDQESENEESDTEGPLNVKSDNNISNSAEREISAEDNKTDKTDGTGKSLMAKKRIKPRTISAHTFHIYIKAAGGYFLTLLLFLTFLLNVGSVTFSSCWLAFWLKDGGGNTNITVGNETINSNNINDNPNLNYYETVYASCILVILFTSLLRAFAITGVTMKAASSLHRQLFSKMIGSSIRFFETTPSGEIQNLFSSDIDVVDNGMRLSLEMFLQTIFTCIFTIFIICFVLPWFVIPLIFLAGLFYFVGRIFRVSMRDFKRLENTSRSPVFSFITATTQGLNTIRAFNKEQEFILKFQELLDESCSYEYFRNLASRWLAIRFDVLSLLCTFIVLIFVICFKGYMAPALAGLALAFVAQTTGLFQFSLRNFSELETRFINIERISFFLRTMISENKLKVTITPTEEWPTQGTIEFKNVKMKYDDNLPLVLNDISFSINDGEKIGIVGRTGGGKSSLANAIFRLCELSEGKITVDGIDISKIDLELLRSKLFNVPQDLVLFGGTIRSHVDPFEQFTDVEIWNALEKSRLKDKVVSMPGQLTESVKSGGSNLSMGEKQLLCLTRAILCRSKILLLDEATASVDPETSAIIDYTIREEFPNCTVIIIAHRLQTVLSCDRVFVMENGKVVEFDKPADLISNPESKFSKMMNAEESTKRF